MTAEFARHDPLLANQQDPTALIDRFGHGTHVAGIISGYWASAKPDGEPVVGTELRDESTDNPVPQREYLRVISGVAPKAKLVSLKVIADLYHRWPSLVRSLALLC